MKKISKILSVILAMVMVLSIIPITASAEADPYSGGWLYYDNGVTSSSFGMGAPEPFYWAVAFPPKDVYNGYTLTKISMVDYYQNVGECTVNIHIGGETAPGTFVSSQKINFTGVHEFVEFTQLDFSTISQHLSALKAADILSTEKRGKEIYYRLTCPCTRTFISCVNEKLEKDKG